MVRRHWIKYQSKRAVQISYQHHYTNNTQLSFSFPYSRTAPGGIEFTEDNQWDYTNGQNWSDATHSRACSHLGMKLAQLNKYQLVPHAATCLWGHVPKYSMYFSIYTGSRHHESSSHLMLTPHNKLCAEISSFTTAWQFPWCCITLCRRISADIEATHLEMARQVPVAQPSSATQLYCCWHQPTPCWSSSSASAPSLPVLHFSRLPHLVFEEVLAVTLSSVTVMFWVV